MAKTKKTPRKIVTDFKDLDQSAALPIGTSIIVRTVTHYYTGKLVAADDKFLLLEDAAWVADTGRWAEALRTGVLSEIEPYPGRCWVAVGAVNDFSPWAHPLPREVK